MPLRYRIHFSVWRIHRIPILYTSGAPGPKIIILALLVLLAGWNLGNAQSVKLYPLSDYETSLRQYHTNKVRTQCIEFEASTKKKWWYYLPQLGFNFGLPTVNGGTSTFVQLDVTKQQNRVKLASIISQGLLDYRTELHQLRSMYTTLLIERNTITELETSWRTTERIFEIAKEAHQKQEIKPVEYYQALLTYQREYSASEARQQNYVRSVIEVARFARHQFPVEEKLPELDSLYTTKADLQPGRRP